MERYGSEPRATLSVHFTMRYRDRQKIFSKQKIAAWFAAMLVVLSAGGTNTRASLPEATNNFLLYVSNERSGDVTVIDPARASAIATFPVGKRPRGIHAASDGRTVYVALSGSPRMGPGADPERSGSKTADKSADGIGVIDCRQQVRTDLLRVGSDPEQFALSRDGTRLVVSNEDTASVAVLELGTKKIVRQLPVAEEPEGIAVNPANGEIYVTCEGDGSIHVLDARGENKIAQFTVGGRPRSVAFLPDGSRAYIPSEGTAAVSVADTRTHRVVATIKLEGERALPMGAVASPDGKTIFVTTGRGNQVAVLDVATNSVRSMINVGDRPWGIAIDPAGRMLYTANGASDDVSVVDVNAGKEINRIKVGAGPWGLAVSPRP
jgi:YVTN family beta-propeller protein